ncbi:Predicted hydrolase (HAD superfamily) [Yersinia frederiksenii]|nr:Predicted hydrolase (HAD superfamily) [Yersinia frederiksenii]CNL26723.1 Predicted hydrolase (HAD superfamily) [Yersinia frederiksenii]
MKKHTKDVYDQGIKGLNMDMLLDAIDKASVVSFDFFDTLFVRPLANPEDAFDLLGAKLNITDFRAQRRKAQSDAFRQMTKDGRKEITLQNIYDKFPLPKYQRDVAQQTEYDLELDLVQPNKELLPLFQQLVASKKMVVITSDMYFSANFFVDALKRYGLEQVPLFISADCNATKRDNGELFDIVASTCNVVPQEILHIGDNYLADVLRPQEKGLATFHYVRELKTKNDKKQSIVTSMIEGLLNTDDAEKISSNTFQELGYRFGGPANLGFLQWITQQATQDAVDVVLFVSRDGYALERLAKEHFIDQLPQFHYFLGSRIAFNMALITEENFEKNIAFLLSGSVGLSPSELFERIGVCPPANRVLQNLGINPHSSISIEDHPVLSELMFAYRHEIIKVCSRNRRGLFMYLCQSGVKAGNKVALVDVGWSGTTQEAFEFAVHPMLDIEVVGYYFCLADTPERQRRSHTFNMKSMISKDSTSSSIVDNIYENRVVIEMFFSAPHNTIIGYCPSGLSVDVISDPGRIKATGHEQFSQEINEGIDIFVESFTQQQEKLNISFSPLQTVAPIIELVSNTQWRTNPLIGQIKNFDSWGSSRNQIVCFNDYFKN